MNPELAARLGSLGDLFIDSRRLVARSPPFSGGAFGVVYSARLLDQNLGPMQKETSSLVAVKRLDPMSYNEQVIAKLIQEIRAWKDLNNRYILPLTGFFLSADLGEALLISPWKDRGSLINYLREADRPPLERLWHVIQTLNAVYYMHNIDLQLGRDEPRGIIHGDLKASNVLIDNNFDLILCDVGLARLLRDPYNPLEDCSGPIRWMSPELLQGNSTKTKSSDMWGWACLALEIIAVQSPFGHLESDVQVTMAILGGAKPGLPFDLNGIADVWTVISPCWEFEASARPSAEQCFAPLISLFATAVERVLRTSILKSSAISRPRKTKAKVFLDRLIDSTAAINMGEMASHLDEIARLTKSTGDIKTTNILYAVRDDIRLNHVE